LNADSNEERLQLAVLHKHWVTADSISYHLRQSVNSGVPPSGLPEPQAELAQQLSTMAGIAVWYSLLYVVIEGYQELNQHDEAIDELLARGDFADKLRRFRNATFHFQAEPLPEKLMAFLTAQDSEKWIRALDKAFRHFFERRLRIGDMLKRLGWRSGNEGTENNE
jgi:hypothetical protein